MLSSAASDYRSLTLREGHESKPMWICADGKVIVELFAVDAKKCIDFLVAIGTAPPHHCHVAPLNPHS